MITKTTRLAIEDNAVRLYEEICSIKTEAPPFDADWDRLALEAREKRLQLIQKAFDEEWTKGYERAKQDVMDGA